SIVLIDSWPTRPGITSFPTRRSSDLVHCERCGIVPVPEAELPVLLPEVDDYTPKGKSPLAAAEDWIRVPCPNCGGEGRREADTRSEEHTSELQSRFDLVCRLLLEKKK